MTTSLAPISDRDVGGLQNIPQSPHHRLTPNHQFSRSDPDISKSSPTTTPSVPRSSSFTRSKRFLTGDGLSAREALGIIDNNAGPPIESESVRIVQSFDIARSAMNEIFGAVGPSGHHSPPPPPKVLTSENENKLMCALSVPVAPPLPPPPPPLFSRLVSEGNATNSTRGNLRKNKSLAELSFSPQPTEPLSTLMPAKSSPVIDDQTSVAPSVSSTSDKSKSRVRRATSPTGRETKFAKGSRPLALKRSASPGAVTEAPNESPHSNSMPKSKSITKLFGIFAPANSHPIGDDTIENTTDTATRTSKYQTIQTAGGNALGKKSSRPLPCLRKVSGRVPPSDKNHDSVQVSAAMKPQNVDGQSFEAAERKQEMFTSDDDSSLSNIADLVVRERPLLPRESRSASIATRGNEQGDAQEGRSGHGALGGVVPHVLGAKWVAHASDLSPNLRAVNTMSVSVDAPVQTGAVTAPAEGNLDKKSEYVRRRIDLFKKFRAIEDYIKHDLNPVSDPEHMPRNPCTESRKKPEIPVRLASDKSVPGEDKPASPWLRKVCNGHSPVPNDDDVSFTSAQEDLSDIHETDKSVLERCKYPKTDDVSDFEKSPKSSVESPTVESMTTSSSSQSRRDRFCEHPGPVGANPDVYQLRGGGMVDFSGALIDESFRPSRHFPLSMIPSNSPSGVNAHGFMDGPVLDAVVEENTALRRARRDSHAAFLQTLADSRDNEASQQAENKAEPQAGMRKTKSGLRQRIVATAKKLPRGRSFPRLRSSGDTTRSEWRPAAKSKSLSRQAKEREARNEEASKSVSKKPTQRPEVTECKLRDKKVNEPAGKISRSRIVCVGEGTGADKELQSDTTKVDEKRMRQEHKMMVSILMNDVSDKKVDETSPSGDQGVRHDACKFVPKSGNDQPPRNMVKIPDAGSLVKEEKHSTATTAQASRETKTGMKAEVFCATGGEMRNASKSNATREAICNEMKKETQRLGHGGVSDTKNEARRSKSGFASTSEGAAPMVTIERVIRRTKADGSSEMVKRKIRVRPERVLANGDVVVKRTLQRMKEDGSGTETMTVMQVIAKRRNENECKEKENVGMKEGLATTEGVGTEGCGNLQCSKPGENGKSGEKRMGVKPDSLPVKGREGEEIRKRKEGEMERETEGWKRVWTLQGKEGGGKWVWRK